MRRQSVYHPRLCHVSTWVVLAVLVFCSPAPAGRDGDREPDPSQAMRAKILRIAEAYASHKWTATEQNVFHGKDPDGVQVDTPDDSFCKDGWHADGRQNVGLPYRWGGFCTIEEFDDYVAQGAYAGHAHTSGDARASHYCVGVDCSGFVSRCLDFPQKQTSLSMALLCYELESYDDLLPGDILNRLDGHVVLFKEFVGEGHQKICYYEAGNWRVKETVRSAENLSKLGFVPMRYKPLDPRWVHLDFSKPSFSAGSSDTAGSWQPDAGVESATLADIPNPFGSATCGEWARYHVNQTRSPRERTVTRGVSSRDGGGINLQVISTAGGKQMMTEKIYDGNIAHLDLLLGFAAYDQDFDNIELVSSCVERGTYSIARRKFDAKKITANVTCSMRLHGKNYPVDFSIECYQSAEVPLEGMLAAEYNLEVTWTGGRKMAAKRVLTLLEFYSGSRRGRDP